MKKVLLLLVLMVLGGAAYIGYLMTSPYNGFEGEEVFVGVERGATSRQIAGRLAAAGVVPNGWSFLLVRAVRSNEKLLAGEYHFTQPASPWTVFSRIARGDIFLMRVTVPEGYSIFDIADLFQTLGFGTKEEFLAVAREPRLIADLAPEARSLEGYLYPDTYRVSRKTSARELAEVMTSRFRETWKSLGTNEPVHRTVTMASLVEKETGVGDERPVVASVYWNRLERGISLDCDPTVIYAAQLEGRYRGTIYRSDLLSPHPYNTYRNPGLPPGPIANPGLASLKATLNPADTDYIFFVAKPGNSGAHTFSKTLEEHNRAVQVYRKGQAQ